MKNWDDVYLFTIVYFTKEKRVDAFMLSVKDIVEEKVVLKSLGEHFPFEWIDISHTKEFLKWINRVWL